MILVYYFMNTMVVTIVGHEPIHSIPYKKAPEDRIFVGDMRINHAVFSGKLTIS